MKCYGQMEISDRLENDTFYEQINAKVSSDNAFVTVKGNVMALVTVSK